MQKERLALHEDIEAWRSTQALVMTGIAEDVASVTVASTGDAESSGLPQTEIETLLLPSSLLARDEEATSHPWFNALSSIELQLRRGQANGAMQTLIATLQYERALSADKRKHVSGNAQHTRAQGIVDTAASWSAREAEVYEQAREAIWILGDDKDKARYRELKKKDKEIKSAYQSKQLGDGWKTDSWIMEFGSRTIAEGDTKEWEEEGMFFRCTTMTSDRNSENLGRRVQWFRARLDALQWKEEEEILESEMERLFTFNVFMCDSWRMLGDRKGSPGHREYAMQAADVYARRADACLKVFAPAMKEVMVSKARPKTYVL